MQCIGNLNRATFELNFIIQRKAEFSFFGCWQKYYKQGERAGKLVAQRVKRQQTQTSDLCKDKGEILTDTVEINKAFYLF